MRNVGYKIKICIMGFDLLSFIPMSIELKIEITRLEGKEGGIQVNKVDNEDFPSLDKAVEVSRERYKDRGRIRDIAVMEGISMGLLGAWMIQYGVAKGDGRVAAVGEVLQGAGIGLSVYGLTAAQEKYKVARDTLNQLRERLINTNQ